ncbi:MAG: alpha/beta hydrolase, partial [Bacteroidetes bacterium]|nr:alpha/beta hydrolase [Bacteroidota bacterium]
MKMNIVPSPRYLIVMLVVCVARLSAQSTKPFIIGEITEITSKVLGEKRVLNIYLPEGYKADDTTKYPVIYLLDGSA